MPNLFYTPTGNPATGSAGLSSLVRSEFAAIGAAFDSMPQITTTGLFSTVFNQQGNYTFTLPASAGTLALSSEVATETARATAAETATAATVTANTTAIALRAPLASPTFTGTVTVPTPATLDNSTKAVNSTWVSAFLAASGYAPTGASPVTSVAGRTGAVTLSHTDITDWVATLLPYAPLASPALTGVPVAPTAAPGVNSTQIATTGYTTAAVAVETAARTAADALLAPKASPTFTGTVNGAAATFSGAVTAASYGAVHATTGAFSGAVTGASYAGGPVSGTSGTFTSLTSGGVAVVTNNAGTWGINISGTAATATNLVGGAVTATSATFSGGIIANGGFILPNSVNFSAATADGVARPAIHMSADNTFNIRVAGGTTFRVLNANGTLTLFDVVNSTGVVEVPFGALNVQGSTVGSVGGAANLSSTGVSLGATGAVTYSGLFHQAIVCDTNVFVGSDARTKTDVAEITEAQALEWIGLGRPVTFNKEGRRQSGFIAQDDLGSMRAASVLVLASEDPVFAESDGVAPAGHKLIKDYQHEIAYLVRGLQVALARIDALESRR